MAIREASGNLGSTILIFPMVLIIAAYGWQTVAIIAAVSYLVIILPLTWLLKDSPESIGLLPDGVTADQVAAARATAARRRSPSTGRGPSYYDQIDFTVKEALRTSAYWSLLAGTMLRQMARAGIEVHLIAIFQWRGMDLATAGLIFTLWAAMNVPAKLLVGYFADRLPSQVVLSAGMLLYVLAFALLLTTNWVWLIAVAAALGGTSEGITPINWVAVGDYFGRRHYATLRGIINMSYSWAWLLMPFASGWWFDRHSNYTVPLAVSIVAAIASAAAYASMRRPRLPPRLVAVLDAAQA
jgi:sugar phosphate permease